MTHKRLRFIFIIFISVIAFYYRMKGLGANHPFWVDEFSTAAQANYILKYGWGILTSAPVHLEQNNFLYHLIVAFFIKIFGDKVWVIRLPAVLFGSLVPLAVFLLTEKLSTTKTAVGAAILTAFSYFQIVWSRQARSYSLQQLILILIVYVYVLLMNRKRESGKLWLTLAGLMTAGILTHKIFIIVLLVLCVHFLITNRDRATALFTTSWTYLAIAVLTFFFIQNGLFNNVSYIFHSGILKTNNLWYYHAFLWREYGLLTFLGITGLILLKNSKSKELLLISLFLVFYLIFLVFLFPPYTSRYLLVIFPFLFLGTAYTITYCSDLILQNRSKRRSIMYSVLPVIIILGIITNGYKFVTKPKSFYSVNYDFREIALVDYDKVYGLIKDKGDISRGQTAVIDTWFDRLYWYMGDDYPSAYLFRWINNPGLTNGLTMKTDYGLNSDHEKIVPHTRNLRFIGELSDLKKAMKKYPKGFIFIDDSTLPKDVLQYAEKNFKKELSLDHYPLDDNPYSVWPATLYSWGIK